MLRDHYDLAATAGSAGVLLIVGAPWPFWAFWMAIFAYQLTNRWTHRHAG